MGLDLEAIRKRVAELSGINRTSSVHMWKPTVGEHKIRCLPWKNLPDGSVFAERWFYYLEGAGSSILAPNQFGKPDPIHDMIRKLYSTNKPEDREIAKKLKAKMRCYAPVVVRGQEDRGVLVWSFGKIVYQRMLGFFLDEDVGDILSPTDGFDLKVTLSQAAGKQFMDTVVDAARRPSKLHEDPAVAQKWMESIPNIDDMYKLKSTQEIETMLSNYFNGGASQEELNKGGTTRGPAASDELDKLVAEVKDPPAAAQTEAPKKASSKKSAPAVEKKSLDDAFADLMDE